jgi:hypothetical protein
MRDATLTPANLLDVLATARASAYLGRLMRRLDENLPLLGALARDLPERPQLETRIGESVGGLALNVGLLTFLGRIERTRRIGE